VQTTFQAIRHNQTTKTQTPVRLRLEPGVLRIEDEGLLQEWLASDIQSARKLDDGSVILQNGPWFLDVHDAGFAPALEHYFGNKRLFQRTFFDRIGLMGCLLALLVFLIPILLAFLWLAPFLAERAAKNVSPEVEQQIGDSWYQSLTANYQLDSSKTRLTQQFYDSLHFGGAYAIKITVVQEPVVNAFAVPGGHIVVFDSILGIMDGPEQLAGLLAHEASHIQLKHSTRAIFRELANQLFISLIFGDYGSVSGIVAQHGGQLAGLSYSRSLELEADTHGLKLLEKSRIPAQGMPELFKKMEATAVSDAAVPSFLSTHPAMEERILAAEKQLAANPRRTVEMPASLKAIWAQLRN
jgi:predicted Zn-dependent protease